MKKIIVFFQCVFILMLAVVIGAMTMVIIHYASEAGSRMVITEINDMGEARYYEYPVKVLEDGLPDESLQRQVIREFIYGFRCIDLDPDMFPVNGNQCLSKAEGSAENMVKEYFSGIDYENTVGTVSVDVPLNEIIATELNEGHWYVKWRELRYEGGKNRIPVSDDYYNGIIRLHWRSPSGDYEKTYNPLGVFIYEFDYDLLRNNRTVYVL